MDHEVHMGATLLVVLVLGAIFGAGFGVGYLAGKPGKATNLGRALKVRNSVHRLGEATHHVWVLVEEDGEVTPVRLTPGQYASAKVSAASNPEDTPPWERGEG